MPPACPKPPIAKPEMADVIDYEEADYHSKGRPPETEQEQRQSSLLYPAEGPVAM